MTERDWWSRPFGTRGEANVYVPRPPSSRPIAVALMLLGIFLFIATACLTSAALQLAEDGWSWLYVASAGSSLGMMALTASAISDDLWQIRKTSQRQLEATFQMHSDIVRAINRAHGEAERLAPLQIHERVSREVSRAINHDGQAAAEKEYRVTGEDAASGFETAVTIAALNKADAVLIAHERHGMSKITDIRCSP